jgi:hypothetical protein
MAEISEQLEDLAGRYPALTIDVQFLPEVEARARESITEETTAALLGNSGRRVERLLLLKQSTALEVEQHISKVMIELETDEERRAFWTRTERRIAELRAAVDRLLERDYFCEAPS